jgi:copper(I)-binding protein
MRRFLLACWLATVAGRAVAVEYRTDRLVVTSPWSRATDAADGTAVGFMTISNTGGDADALISASCDGALVTSLHDTAREKGLPKSLGANLVHVKTTVPQLDLPAHSTVVMTPQGVHLLMENRATGIKQGQQVSCLLRFRYAGPMDIQLMVGPADATGAPPDPPAK